MTTETEQLVVQLEARISQFEKNFQRANRSANENWNRIEQRGRLASKRIQDDMNRLSANVSASSAIINRSLGLFGVGIGTAQTIRSIQEAAAEYVNLQNALKVTGLEGEGLEHVLGQLFNIAQKNGTALEPLTTLYSRAAQAQKELKASGADLLRFTDGVSLALRVAGTNSQQAAGALLQLSQAIGSGVVRAEEFNSVNEGARPILQAVAAGLKEAGNSVATLKTLVNDGKVSSEAFFRAFLAGMPMLQQQADKASGTVGQAVSRMQNAFTVFIGKLDETVSASKNAAENLTGVAKAIESLPAYVKSAADGLETLRAKLAEFGNLSIFDKINKLLNVDTEYNNARFAGDVLTTKRIDLTRLESDLADARNTASRTGLDIDKQRAEAIEKRLAALREEIRLASGSRGIGGRMAEGALDPLGRAPAKEPIKPVTLKDFPVPGKDKNTVGVDSFERAVASVQKRIAIQQAETAVIDQGTAARERAKTVAELETAAKAANAAAGAKNTEVTSAQRATIDQLAEAMHRSAAAAEAANSPLRAFLREAENTDRQLQNIAVSGLQSFEGAIVDVAMKTKDAGEAFHSMVNGIIADLLRLAVRQSITAPLAAAFSGGGVLNSLGSLLGARADGGPVTANRPYIVGERGPEIVVPKMSGVVIPNHKLNGTVNNAAMQSNVFNVTVQGSSGSVEQNRDLAAQIGKQLEAVAGQMVVKHIRQQMRPGGILNGR